MPMPQLPKHRIDANFDPPKIFLICTECDKDILEIKIGDGIPTNFEGRCTDCGGEKPKIEHLKKH